MCSVTWATARPSHGQHHGELAHAGALGQDLGVPGIVKAGRVQPFLVQRRRHDAVGFAGHRRIDRPAQEIVGGPPGGRAYLPRFYSG